MADTTQEQQSQENDSLLNKIIINDNSKDETSAIEKDNETPNVEHQNVSHQHDDQNHDNPHNDDNSQNDNEHHEHHEDHDHNHQKKDQEQKQEKNEIQSNDDEDSRNQKNLEEKSHHSDHNDHSHIVNNNNLKHSEESNITKTEVNNDNLIQHVNDDKFQTFCNQTLSRLQQIRNAISQNMEENDKEKKRMEIDYHTLEAKYKSQTEQDNEIASFSTKTKRERERLTREIKVKDNKANQLRQLVNNQQTQIASHKKDIEKQKQDFDLQMSRLTEEIEENNKLIAMKEEILKREKEARKKEQENKLDSKQEHEKILSDAKKKIDFELTKEKEIRLDFEKRFQNKEEELSKKQSDFVLLQKDNQTFKALLLQDSHSIENWKTQKSEALKKLDERIRSQKETEHKYHEILKEYSALQLKLENMKEQNQGLRQAISKKEEKEKTFKDKEKIFEEKDHSLSQQEKEIQAKKQQMEEIIASQIEKKNISRASSHHHYERNRNFDSESNWINLVPWHFVSAFLLLGLIISIIALLLNRR